MEDTKELEYIAFMCVARHINFEYLEQTLKEYPIGLYLMSAEVSSDSHKETDGEHFHFVVQMKEQDYHKYAKRCFKDKLKLRGKAIDGKPRQYGKVKKIEDLERMCAYTIKQGNIRTNMTDSQLETYKKITFTRKDELTFEDELMDYLVSKAWEFNKPTPKTDFTSIALDVVQFMRNYKRRQYITKTKIEKYVRYYQMYYLKEHLSDVQLLGQLISPI